MINQTKNLVFDRIYYRQSFILYMRVFLNQILNYRFLVHHSLCTDFDLYLEGSLDEAGIERRNEPSGQLGQEED